MLRSFKKNRKARGWVAGLLLCGSTAAFSGTAFPQVYENETNIVVRETRAQERVENAADESQEKRAEQAPRVTYQDILKQPDNVKLNFQYAQTQVKEGNLLGASTTLERILLINPEIHQVRLYYAIVLFRLDNRTEALEEFNRLNKDGVPRAIRSEARAYLHKLRRRQRRTHLSIRESVGFELDSNRNASPSSKTQLVSGTATPISTASARIEDTSVLNITQVNVSRDLGGRAGHVIFAGFTHYLQEQTRVNSLDLGSFQYEAGARLKRWGGVFTPKYYGSHVFLSSETYLRAQGGSFDLSRDFLKKKLGLYSGFRIEQQNFSGISENTTAKERTGTYLSLEPGFNVTVLPRIRYGASLEYADKGARQSYNGYRRLAVKQSVTTLLWRGNFILQSLDLAREVYKEADTSVSAQIRRDNSIRYRLTYGVPLESLFFRNRTPGLLRGVLITVTYEYFHPLSNMPNYTYKNNKFQTMIAKKWEF